MLVLPDFMSSKYLVLMSTQLTAQHRTVILNVITFTLLSFKMVPLPYTLHTRITQIYIRVHILHAEGLHFGAFPLAEDDDKDTEEQKDGSGESVKMVLTLY